MDAEETNFEVEGMFADVEEINMDPHPMSICRFCGPGCRCAPGTCKCELLGQCVCGAGNNRLAMDISLLNTKLDATDLLF